MTAPSNDGADARGVPEDHIEMVRAIAGHLCRKHAVHADLYDDLVAAGTIGLMEAYRRYQLGHGAAFTSFAGWRVRGAMIDELRASLAVGRRAHEKMKRGDVELTARPRSDSSGPDDAVDDGPASDAQLERSGREAFVLSALKTLPERMQRLLIGHYIDERPISDIARELGLSKSWAGRMHAAGLDQLRLSAVAAGWSET